MFSASFGVQPPGGACLIYFLSGLASFSRIASVTNCPTVLPDSLAATAAFSQTSFGMPRTEMRVSVMSDNIITSDMYVKYTEVVFLGILRGKWFHVQFVGPAAKPLYGILPCPSVFSYHQVVRSLP